MRLDLFLNQIEASEVLLNWFEYLECSGQTSKIPISILERYAANVQTLSQQLLQDYPELIQENPRLFYYALRHINEIASRQAIFNVYEARDRVSTNVNGNEISLGDWVPFNVTHLGDRVIRERVFDGIVEDTYYKTARLVQEMYDIERQAFLEYDNSVVNAFEFETGMPIAKVKEILHNLAIAAKEPFYQLADTMWPRIVSGAGIKSADVKLNGYIDYYLLEAILSSGLDQYFTKNPLQISERLISNLGIEKYGKERIDDVDRLGKDEASIACIIRLPHLVMVCYNSHTINSQPAYGKYSNVFHEKGHSTFNTSIDPELGFADRQIIPDAIDEVYAAFSERFLRDPSFLHDELDVPIEYADELAERQRFLDIYYLMFNAPLSLTNIAIFEESLSIEQATELYGELSRKYLGDLAPHPRYWITHHQIPVEPVIGNPTYVLGLIGAENLWSYLQNQFGKNFWRKPKSTEAGRYLQGLFRQGSGVDVSIFNFNNPNSYAKRFGLVYDSR